MLITYNNPGETKTISVDVRSGIVGLAITAAVIQPEDLQHGRDVVIQFLRESVFPRMRQPEEFFAQLADEINWEAATALQRQWIEALANSDDYSRKPIAEQALMARNWAVRDQVVIVLNAAGWTIDRECSYGLRQAFVRYVFQNFREKIEAV